MIKEGHIRKIIQEGLQDSDKFLVSLKIKPGNKILVFIDGDEPVSVQDCANLSRIIESHLDRDTEDFELFVSSAGLDHPLQLVRQYKNNIGRPVEVLLKDGIKKKGVLINADDEQITLREEQRKNKKKKETKLVELVLPYDEIKETKVSIIFKK